MILYEDDHFVVTREQDEVFLQIRHDGLAIKDFQSVLNRYPRIEIKNFSALQQMFSRFTGQPVKFGVWRPLVECSVSSDGMEAKIRIYQTQEELDDNADAMTAILQALEDHSVREGLLADVLHGPYPAQTWMVVARGTSPVSGENAVVRYAKTSERKPMLKSDGKTDFYEMNFIDEIQKGGWLGEKTPATPGIPGRTVTGKSLPVMPGKDLPLRYDPKTVVVVEEGNRSVLRAAIDGAIEWENGRVGVIDRLLIHGDVGVGTGNIEFSGAVVIHGTVQDTFSVVAGKDLSILSPSGIGAINRIVSKEGDIYLRGGVYGHGKAVIEAKGNIYAKHANECAMKAGNEIHIGYYAMGCDLQAKVIMLDKEKGRLIGGHVMAESQVIVAYIGNVYERVTRVSVQGFNRQSVKDSLEFMIKEHRKRIEAIEKVRRLLDVFETTSEPFDDETQAEYESTLVTRDHLESELYRLENSIKARAALLRSRGEGEVSISKAAYPKTHLTIKTRKQMVEKETKGTFYVTEDHLHFE